MGWTRVVVKPDISSDLGVISHSSFRQKSAPFFFKAWKKGLHFFVDRLMNQFRAARRLFNIWISFTQVGDFMFRMVDILSGSALMPRLVTRYLKTSRKQPQMCTSRG